MTTPSFPADFYRIALDNTCGLAFGDRVLELDCFSTREWLAALAAGDLEAIMPRMLLPDDRDWVYRELLSDLSGLDSAHVTRAAQALITQVCGIPWYAAIRLAHVAQQQWFQLDPLLLRKGLDLFELPISRALAMVYFVNTEHSEEKDRAMFDRELWSPVGQEKPSWTAEQQSSSFGAFRRMHSALK